MTSSWMVGSPHIPRGEHAPGPNAELTEVAHRSPGGREVHEGIVPTSGVFCPHDVIGNGFLLWQRAGVVAVESECAALRVIALKHRVESGAVLSIDGNPPADRDEDMAGYDPRRRVVSHAVEAALGVALDALATVT